MCSSLDDAGFKEKYSFKIEWMWKKVYVFCRTDASIVYPDTISKAKEILSIFIHVMIAIEFIFVPTAS